MVEDQVPQEFLGRAEPGNRSKLLLRSDRFVWQTGCQNRQKSTKSDLHGTLKPEMLRVLNSDRVQTPAEVAPSQDAWAHVIFISVFSVEFSVGGAKNFGGKTLAPIKSEPEVVTTGRFERHTGAPQEHVSV
jgi:hypothetical protein